MGSNGERRMRELTQFKEQTKEENTKKTGTHCRLGGMIVVYVILITIRNYLNRKLLICNLNILQRFHFRDIGRFFFLFCFVFLSNRSYKEEAFKPS